MNDQYKETVELVKKHLGCRTPNWVIENAVELLAEFTGKVPSNYECVVAYFDRENDGDLRQSFHKGDTKEEAMRDFFDTHVGEKGANVLWTREPK